MNNEIIDTINRYFDKDENELNFFGDKEIAQKFVDHFSNGIRYLGDTPDMAIVYNDMCLAIEHFEFDSYENTKKGSKNKIEQARIDRRLKADNQISNEYFVHDEISGQSSYEQYINNVSSQFLNHYGKINSYKRNLVDKGIVSSTEQIKMAFLIEDCSPLGSIIYDGNRTTAISLALCPEFLSLLREHPEVEYVFACSGAGSSNFIWLISLEALDEYNNNAINYKDFQFIGLSPKVASFQFIIE